MSPKCEWGGRKVDGEDGRIAMEMLVALVLFLHQVDRRVRVLEFGGGVPHDYTALLKNLPKDVRKGLEYHILETPREVEKRKRAEHGHVFFSSIPEDLTKVEVVYSNCVLQCLESEDWKAEIAKLMALKPSFVYLTRKALQNEAPTFRNPVRLGDGKLIQGWYINRDELVEHVESFGYGLKREEYTSRGTEWHHLKFDNGVVITHYAHMLFVEKGLLIFHQNMKAILGD